MATEGRRTASGGRTRVRRMPRAERREQILDAATRAFAAEGAAGDGASAGGFAATALDDIAGEAGITRVLLYRHFDSKADLYRAVLDRACDRLARAVGVDDFDENSIPALLNAAAGDPDGFRLLFHHAAREPEFREFVDALGTASTQTAARNLAHSGLTGAWLDWAARLVPGLTIDAVIAWLDAGRPDPEHAAQRIEAAVHGVIRAAQANPSA